MKTVIIHDWIMTIGGSERVLEAMYEIYPSPIYMLVKNEQALNELTLKNAEIHTSFVQKLPRVKKNYRNYLMFFPMAIEKFDMSGYDVILSSSHAVAKGVHKNPKQLHICYCHTPIRYAWDLREQYLKETGFDKGLKGWIAKKILSYIKNWDYKTAVRVNYFIANSQYIADRIKRAYGRDSVVIYPPVDIDRFEVYTKKENFYLTASRMVPYKKIDLIVETFSEMPDKKLVVIGGGPSFEKIKSKAGNNVELLGIQPFNVLKDYMQKAKAFVFAAEEDFGIVSVEAQACGTPVIAYGAGGSLETIIGNKTGVFFQEQTIDGLTAAVGEFEKNMNSFDCNGIRKNAERFGTERFRKEFKMFVESKIDEFKAKTDAGGRL